MNDAPLAAVLYLVGAVGSTASAVLLLLRYRREPLDEGDARHPVWPSLVLGIAFGALSGRGRRLAAARGGHSPRRHCVSCGGATASACAW